MPTVVLAALLLGDLTVGSGSAGLALGIPSQLGDIVQATVLLVTVAVLIYRRFRQQARIPDAPVPDVVEVDTS